MTNRYGLNVSPWMVPQLIWMGVFVVKCALERRWWIMLESKMYYKVTLRAPYFLERCASVETAVVN
jgi:hypothetical protein